MIETYCMPISHIPYNKLFVSRCITIISTKYCCSWLMLTQPRTMLIIIKFQFKHTLTHTFVMVLNNFW